MSDTEAAVVLTLPDGSTQEVDSGTTALEIAQGIGERLARDAIGAELDGELIDLRLPLESGGRFRILTGKNPESGDFIRHSAEHVMADAVKRLWPEVELDVGEGVGPLGDAVIVGIDEGIDDPVDPEGLPLVEHAGREAPTDLAAEPAERSSFFHVRILSTAPQAR